MTEMTNREICLADIQKGRCKVTGRIMFESERKSTRRGVFFYLKPAIIGGIYVNGIWVEAVDVMRREGATVGETMSFTGKVSLCVDAEAHLQKVIIDHPYGNIKVF